MWFLQVKAVIPWLYLFSLLIICIVPRIKDKVKVAYGRCCDRHILQTHDHSRPLEQGIMPLTQQAENLGQGDRIVGPVSWQKS